MGVSRHTRYGLTTLLHVLQVCLMYTCRCSSRGVENGSYPFSWASNLQSPEITLQDPCTHQRFLLDQARKHRRQKNWPYRLSRSSSSFGSFRTTTTESSSPLDWQRAFDWKDFDDFAVTVIQYNENTGITAFAKNLGPLF